jgi:hypothetical protein
MADAALPMVVETTAGRMSEVLARRGIGRDQPVTIMIEPDDWLTEARRFSRPRVIAEGWSDADIDRIIHEERQAVHALPPGNG